MLKRMVVAMSVLAFWVTGACAAGDWEWIPFEEGVPEGTEPEAGVLQSDQQSTTIDFAVRGMYRQQKVEEGETYDVLRFTRPLGSRSIVTGCPEVPLVLWNIAIPPTTNVRVGLDSAFVPALKLEGYRVYPSQPDYLEGDPQPPFTYDEEVYATDSFYPGEMVELGDISVVSGVREVLVRLKPVQFNPVTGELMVYTSGRIVLEYYGLSHVNIVENPRPPSHHHEASLRRNILNYDQFAAQIRPVAKPADFTVDYLVVEGSDALGAGVDDLVGWRQEQGLDVGVESAQGLTYSQVKTLIQTYYNDYSIGWVLLVGDYNTIPLYDDGTSEGDNQYACVTGDDDKPDICIGRLPGSSQAAVESMAEKIIKYEKYQSPGSWVTEVQLVSHKDATFEECSEEIREASYADPPTFYTVYGSNEYMDNAIITSRIDGGAGIVNYRGHGSTYQWYHWNTTNDDYETTNVVALDNCTLTPVIFSITCSTAETLGPVFVSDADRAVGFLGAVDDTYTYVNNYYDPKLFDLIYDDGETHVGQVVKDAACYIIEECGSDGERNANRYVWLGDPYMCLSVDAVSIQSAINAAASGQTVYVAGGEYTEALEMRDDVSLEAAGGAYVVVEATGSSPAATFYYDDDVTVKEITFEGTGSYVVSIWGGSNVVLDEVVASGSSSSAGAYVRSSYATIQCSRFFNCDKGLYFYSGGPSLDSCYVRDNDYGVYSYNHSTLYLETGSYFKGNSTDDIYGDGQYDIYARNNWWEGDSPDVSWTGPMSIYTSPIRTSGNPWAKPVATRDWPSDEAWAWQESARERKAAGDLTGALEDYKRIVEQYPESNLVSLALSQIVDIYAKLRLRQEGVDYLEHQAREHAVAAVYEECLYLTVGLLTGLDRYTEGLGRCDEFVSEFPESDLCPAALMEKAGIYKYGLRDHALATAAFARIIAEYPESEDASIARTYLDIEDPPKAEPAGERASSELMVYPNPSNPSTTLQFGLQERQRVTLAVYSALGQQVAVLIDGGREAGHHSVTWDGRDEHGMPLASGLYFVRLVSGQAALTRRMILLK